MRFTREQADCISIHDTNLIVIAGAGSGKTRILVERFTGLLEAHPDWPLLSIVAITFTEKAAREMRDRVRQQIEDRLRAARERHLRELWLNHQSALNSARIGTIHSLCATILRSNPAEAGIDPGFDVLDEIEAGIVLDDAVRETLAMLARSGNPAAELLRSYGVQMARDVLKMYAGRARSDLACSSLNCGPEELVRRWQTAWIEQAERMAREAQADLPHLFAWAPTNGWPESPDDKLLGLWQRAYDTQTALFDGDPEQFVAGLDTLCGLERVGSVGKKAVWGDDLDEAQHALLTIQAWARDTCKSLLPRLTAADEEAARLLVLWREAIQAAASVYRSQKQARNGLDFDDLETLTHDLLVNNLAVQKRYAAEFRHVLVDEFQDTNAAQRDIVYHLTGAQSGRLFLVGDPKQSIYAFRGADVSVFGAVRSDLTHHGGRELPLSTSFRTHSALVNAFNEVFSRILQVEDGPCAPYQVGLDAPMHAHRPADPRQHSTPLSVIAIAPADETQYPGWKNADDLRRWEAWEIAKHIHGMIAAETLIWDRNLSHSDPKRVVFIPDFARDDGRGAYRRMDYGDVALLFQASTHMPLYEDVFKAAALPYVTVGGKGYYNRQEVWDLLNLLRALHNPTDDLALAAALRSPLFGLSDDGLYALRLLAGPDGTPFHLWDALLSEDRIPFFPPDDQPTLAFARDVLVDLRDVAGRATIAELLIRALDQTGYLATLTGLADGARRRGNVEKLLKLARESGRVSLGAFNAYARDLTDREIREGEAAIDTSGAAQLMTVHGSKGLEFPVVVLADASWSRTAHHDCLAIDPIAGPALRLPRDLEDDDKKPDPFAWRWAGQLVSDREKAERRRLLYVGATRAQDYLIVSGVFKHNKIEAGSWLGEWLAALGIDSGGLQPSDQSYLFKHSWGHSSVFVPTTPPPTDLVPRARRGETGWDREEVRAGIAVPGYDPLVPPLLAPLHIDLYAPARALTATQIAKLGRAPFYEPTTRGRAAFRHSVLYDAPEPVRPLPDRCMDQRCLRLIIGKMVHRALQAWVLPGNSDSQVFFDRLATYAWELHITDPLQVDEAVYAASELLKRFEKSEVPARLESAAQVYRELPFMHRIGQQTINGVLDVLYHDRHGKWHVLDYKTAPVSEQGAKMNARRYYLQIGVYASAVQAKTGQMPDAHLYYIQPGTLIEVRPKDWQAALARLEDDVAAALISGAE